MEPDSRRCYPARSFSSSSSSSSSRLCELEQVCRYRVNALFTLCSQMVAVYEPLRSSIFLPRCIFRQRPRHLSIAKPASRSLTQSPFGRPTQAQVQRAPAMALKIPDSMQREDVMIPAFQDRWPLAATAFSPKNAPTQTSGKRLPPVVVLGAATGVKGAFYNAFAVWVYSLLSQRTLRDGQCSKLIHALFYHPISCAV